MNDKNTSQNIRVTSATYQTSIAQLEKQKSKLNAQMEPLITRRSELDREIVARDWILTDNRPKGCSETFSAATEMRKRLYAERNAIARQVGELQNTLNPLNRELAELKCELTYHQNSEITPEAVQMGIDEIHAEIEALKRDRKSLVNTPSTIDDAENDLGSLDEEIKHLEARLKDEQQRLQKLNALNLWAGIMPQVRVAIRNLLEADRDVGRALIESLAHEGLKEFDYRGRMVRPAWLSSKADMINQI
jgi:chromosome segregation ATPase